MLDGRELMENRSSKTGLHLLFSLLIFLFVFGSVELTFRVIFREGGLRTKREDSFIRNNRLHWLEMLQPRNNRITQRDADLLWSNRLNADSPLTVFSLRPQDEQKTYYPIMHWVSNSQGFMGTKDKVPDHKDSREVRVLSLGDSSTVGLGLMDQSQTYSAHLEMLLNERQPVPGQHTYRVINGGVIGYTSTQGLRYLQKNGEALKPDLLIVYFGNNDGALHGTKSDKEIFAEIEKQKGMKNAVQTANNFLDFFYSYRFLREKLSGTKRELKVWSNEATSIRLTPDDYAANLAAFAEWGKVHSVPVIFMQPPVNYFWPPRFHQTDSRDGPLATYRGPVGEYPGYGAPVGCYYQEDCLFNLLGPWFVVNVPEEFAKEKRLMRNGVSLWEARYTDAIGKFSEAEAMYRQWLAGDEDAAAHDEAAALNNLAVILMNSGKINEGEKLLKKARAIDPGAFVVTYNLGSYLLASHGNAAEGMALLKQAMEIDRNNVRLHADFRQALRATAGQLNVPVVAMDEENENDAKNTGQPLFFVDYTHPSVKGHRLLAEKILAEMIKPETGMLRSAPTTAISSAQPQ